MSYWRECPVCGAKLDPGETCDCGGGPGEARHERPGLRPPLRDVQQDRPVGRCTRCGGEVYAGERVYAWRGTRVCVDCFRAGVTAWLAEAPHEVAAALDVGSEEA